MGRLNNFPLADKLTKVFWLRLSQIQSREKTKDFNHWRIAILIATVQPRIAETTGPFCILFIRVYENQRCQDHRYLTCNVWESWHFISFINLMIYMNSIVAFWNRKASCPETEAAWHLFLQNQKTNDSIIWECNVSCLCCLWQLCIQFVLSLFPTVYHRSTSSMKFKSSEGS